MMNDRKKTLSRTGMATSAAIAIAAIGGWQALAQTAAKPGPFTDAQAQAGQAAYAQNCAKCHDSGEAPPLTGAVRPVTPKTAPRPHDGAEPPPLTGAGFLNVWASRSTHDLFARVKDTM